MAFLENLTKITDTKYSIGYIHYQPLDSMNGLGKTKEQLEQEGVLIESIPEPDQLEGKQAIMYWNPAENKLFYEYEDIPKPKEEILQSSIKALGQTVAQEKIKNMQKDETITQLGQELAKVKLDIIKLQGGK